MQANGQAEARKRGHISRKIMGYFCSKFSMAGRCALRRNNWFPDFIPRRMNTMAVDSGELGLPITRSVEIDLLFVS